MQKSRDYSISRKLTRMNMLVSAVALLLACTAFFGYDLLTWRGNRVRGLSIQADIIGSNSVSAMMFNDAKSAENTLSALRAAPNITYAGIYTADGQPFAAYWRDRGAASMPPLPAIPHDSVEQYWFKDDGVDLARRISFQGSPEEIVYIRSDLTAMYDRLRRYAIIVLIVLGTSLLAALLISRMSQRVVSEPIIGLAETAKVVSREKNYSVRASPTGNRDELNTLIESFNEMLEQIQQRDSALQKAHDELEGRVKERTAELKAAEEGLRKLSNRLLQIQDEERRHIARELHDSSGQVLAALGMNLATIQSESNKLSPNTSEVVKESINLVEATLKELRTMSYLLHPPLLDEAGLGMALHWFVEGFSERSKIPVTLEVAPNLGRLSRELETTIFRIVQESLTNIHRHSQSPTARIRISRNDKNVCLEVEDHGKGMPLPLPGIDPKAPRLGVGIQGMQERARQLGGQLEIRSGTGGTLITALLPINS